MNRSGDTTWRHQYRDFCDEIVNGSLDKSESWLQDQVTFAKRHQFPDKNMALMNAILGSDWDRQDTTDLKLFVENRREFIDAWNQNSYALGKIVYYEKYDNVYPGMVVPSVSKVPDGYLKLEGIDGIYGLQYEQMANCYPSREAVVEASNAKIAAEAADILESIHDVKDLVRYLYDNNVAHGEEYTNYAGRAAVHEAAKKFLGIDLDQPETQQTEQSRVPVLSDADLQFTQTESLDMSHV